MENANSLKTFEKAARALSRHFGNDPDCIAASFVLGPNDGRPNWMGFAPLVQVVVEAIREPDEAMLEAGFSHAFDTDAQPESVYTAMIDVLLKEATRG